MSGSHAVFVWNDSARPQQHRFLGGQRFVTDDLMNPTRDHGQPCRGFRTVVADCLRERNEAEANGYGPPRRPQRGYHGKRDLKPLEE